MDVNSLCQCAAEDLSLVNDGDPISGELAASCVGCLNRAIAGLNADSYISLSVNSFDTVAAGNIVFKKLEEGEEGGAGIVDREPPDSVSGVSRKVGIRWFALTPANREQMDRALTYSLPMLWTYSVSTEAAPSGNTRRVGTVRLNGNCPTELRVYENSALPNYQLGDQIYLSDLYYTLILYALEEKLCIKYKLASYRDNVDLELAKAKKAIDTVNANNRPTVNGLGFGDSYMTPYFDLLGGVGF